MKKHRKHRSSMVEGVEVQCGACGEPWLVFVDPSGGLSQSYVEDCQVCCRPHRIEVAIDEEDGSVQAVAWFE